MYRNQVKEQIRNSIDHASKNFLGHNWVKIITDSSGRTD